MVDPPFRAREVAAFLRGQFARASIDAQRRFLAILERGPEPELVKRLVEVWRSHGSDETGSDEGIEGQGKVAPVDAAALNDALVRDVIADWQRRRLRWFHDRIPDLLAPLAGALEVSPRIPSARDQALDEVGSWSGGVSSLGYRSPTTADALAAMSSPEAIADYLRTWHPSAGVSPVEEPSREGLEQALTLFVTKHPANAAALAQLLPGAALAPGYLAAVLAGFEAVADAGQSLPWPEVVALVEYVLSEADRTFSTVWDGGADSRAWRNAAYAVADLLRKACANNVVPVDSQADVWRLAQAIVRSPVTWGELQSSGRPIRVDSEPREEVLGDLESAALNSLQGHVVWMLIDVALWDFRRLEQREESDAKGATTGEGQRHYEFRDASATASRVVPLVESCLQHADRSGRLAQTMLGDFIPQLMLVARRWVLDHVYTLFADGASSPGQHPTWGAYLARAGFYDSVFRDLREWYLRAADEAPDPTPGSERSDWSVSRNLAQHTIIAVVRGAATVGDQDGLVERVFSRVRVQDRAHAYWCIFRHWSDAKAPVPDDFVRRLVAFWEWRVSVLETQAESQERTDEADGLAWFLRTPYIKAADAIRLGLRTLGLVRGNWPMGALAWERLGELAQHDPAGTFELAELLARRALRTDYPYLPYPQVAPPLRAALAVRDSNMRSRVRRLINDLGERGLLEFGELLGELGAAEND